MRIQRIVLLGLVIGLASATAVFVASRASRNKNRPPNVSHAVQQVETPPIQVLVTKLNRTPGRVEYHYTVNNGGAFPVHTLIVGNDEYSGRSLLRRYPMGWDGDTIPSSSFQKPPGWTFAVESTEEDSLVKVKWVVSKQGRAIMGGESAGGFAVVVDQADPAYESGGLWTAYVMGEAPFWGTLRASGVTSVPTSSLFAQSDLKVSPNPAAGTVTIQFAMPTAGKVTVDIFDVEGSRVRRVVEQQRAVGASSVSWDGKADSGKAVGSGVYFIRVKTPSTQRFARITWLPKSKQS